MPDFNINTGAITLIAWIKPGNIVDTHHIIDGNGGWASLYQNGNSVHCQTADGPAQVNGGSSITADNWHHIACTYDGSQIRIYIDGTQVGSTSASGSIHAGEFWKIRREERVGGLTYGFIDSVAIYNRALTSDEIREYASL